MPEVWWVDETDGIICKEGEEMSNSLTSGEILEKVIEGKPLTKNEILELYADSANWVSDYNSPTGSHRYIWKGSVICAWEAARWGLELGKKK